ncbi:hypothetical protein M758_3G242300 [Ceratodon purpureus]|uniref:BED-type domain-containing protein n=1 Tax=Ceratodon purpureus TaxID=3225 RepID=A0A8T0IPA4_CERPU|nr:hypothetical protein KC19_3G237900 [Ceratodon purpureus]KAG0624357.1 hypothetical protein M758_3G242300 [Ceratodon purpureus]
MTALNSNSMTEGHALALIDGGGALPLTSRSAEDSEEIMMEQLTALENQQAFWRVYHRNSPTWAFFTTNDSCPVDLVKPQLMRCIVCHPSRRETMGLRSTRCRKGVVLYNKEHGTSAMKRHVHAEHPQSFSRYKALRTSAEPSFITPRQPTKKRSGSLPGSVVNIYSGSNPQKEDEQQQQFLEDLALYVLKAHQPLSSVENVWLRRLLLSQCPRLLFPSRLELVEDVIHKLETKTMEKYVVPSLAGCSTATVTFDLWMSHLEGSIYAVVVNFINDAWIPCNVTVGLVESSSMSETPLAVQLQEIVNRFNLTSRIIAYVKDEGSSLDIVTTALASVVSCEVLDSEPFIGTCFGHALTKCCQHATDDSKVCAGLKAVNLKDAQASLQKFITSIQHSRKGRQEWAKACAEKQLSQRMLKPPVKTRFASRALFFQESLDYIEAITTFSSGQSSDLQLPLPSPQTWAVARAATETLIPVVKQSVLKQNHGFWFLSEALAAALTLSIHFRQSHLFAGEVTTSNGDGDFDGELLIMKSRMEEEVLAVLEPLLSFAGTFSRQSAHNMLALMLDPRFKGLGLVRDYVGPEKVVGIVFEYDNLVLLPLLMQCYKRLHPTAQSQEPVTPISENSIFGAQASAEEVILEQLKSELSLFRRLHVADGDYDSPLLWWKKHEKEFRNVAYLARQILGIVGSQVEIERIFSITGVILSQQRRRLGTDHLEKLVFISKNWPDEQNNVGKLEDESVEHFLEIEDIIIDDNVHLIEEADLFEK